MTQTAKPQPTFRLRRLEGRSLRGAMSVFMVRKSPELSAVRTVLIVDESGNMDCEFDQGEEIWMERLPEPYKIKMVEPLNMISKEERREP